MGNTAVIKAAANLDIEVFNEPSNVAALISFIPTAEDVSTNFQDLY